MEIPFDHLMRSIDRQTFLREYFDRQVYHEIGSVQDVGRLFSWVKLNDLLDRPKLWDGRSVEMALDGQVLPAAQFCRPGIGRTGDPNLRPDRAKVTALLRKGATFVLDFLEGIDPEIGAATRCIERLTGTTTSCNVYCSWQQVRGYASHFDTMDVFAIQIEGEKTWNIYEGRFPEAVFVPGIRPSDFSKEQHDGMKGAIARQITTRPGDILYIPRGQYHDAIATDQASLHLSFGATPSVGFTVVGMLASEMQKPEFYRRRLPHFEERGALARYLAEIGDHLNTVLNDPAFVEHVAAYLKDRTFEKVSGYRFPDRAADGYFFVTRHTPTLIEDGDRLSLRRDDVTVSLAHEDRPMLEWILGREVFWLSALSEAHGARGPAGDQLIKSLIANRIIFPIQV
ncbi:MAG: hypothetical protein HQ481_03285 [Alphaproteobacteria bacterium]|nr:hypothetical protein [Alphaproteobacteria bacterium]